MSGADDNRLDGPLRQLLAVVVIGVFLSVLDMTVVNVALRTLSARLDASVTSVQWVVTGYLLALAAAIPLTGWAARRFGARRVYIACLVLFTLGSALCGLSWSLGSLIVARVIQGLGGGAIFPVAQTILARQAGPRRMARTMSIIGSVAVCAPVLGPIMGGFIIDNASWRWIFLVNVPIGVLGYVLAVTRLPIDEPEEAGRLDVIGLLLMGIGLPLFTYAFAEVGEGTSFLSWRGGGLVLVSVVLMGLFVRHALRTDQPLLNLRLFSNPTYATASAASFVLGAAVFGPYLVMPLFFQEVQHASPMLAGALFAAQGIGAGVSIRIGGVLGHRISAGILATCGAIVMIIFTLPLVTFDQATPKIESVIVLAGRGFGIGLAMIPVMAAALASLPRVQLPDGAAQTNVLQRVGSSIATTAIAVLLGHELASHRSGPAGLASAYQDTLWAAVGLAVLVLPFALALLRRQRHVAVVETSPPSPAIVLAEAAPGLD